VDLYEISDQVVALLQQRGRLAYRALKLQFHLDDEQLEALKDEVLFSHPTITEEAGRGLVWMDPSSPAPNVQRPASEARQTIENSPTLAPGLPDPRLRPPVSYTPAHLAERIRAVTVTDGERKTITALFADLKGSTALIEGLDPEEARALIDPALHLMMDAVHRYDGFVAQALGDGIFALFGAPLAHEDHPQRALYAALGMQDAIRRYADTLRAKGYPPLLMRVGLNTGEVVLRSIRKDDLHTDYVPVGHSTNLAARMEQLATPGTIVVSAYTYRLTDYRPEYRHEWGQKTYYTQLRLTPLGQAEAEEFLDAMLGASPLPNGARDRVRGSENNLQPLKRLILDKTQGTPFFMEEVVQTLIEDGTLTGTPGHYQLTQHASTQHGLTLQIPTTLQAVLASRIDRLAPEEKAFLQQLAVIGRQFPLGLLRQVLPQPEDTLHRLLASLQHKEFLYEQPAFPESEYLFKHALTQDVAYGTVLHEQRKILHEHTATAMEALYQQKLDDHYGDLAHHYGRSGNIQKAVDYLQLAGQQATQRSAHEEAIAHLTAAIELLATLPDSPARTLQELMLQIALGPTMMALKGYAPEVEHAYSHALTLCQQVGETPQLFPTLWGLWVFHLVQAELPTARQLGEQLLTLARSTQDSALLLEAHIALGETLYFMGEGAQAQASLEQGVTFYDAQNRRALLRSRTLAAQGGVAVATSGTVKNLNLR
jgi:class 3 adenylate cyclase/tetratricopeptide (TPR) repeat protein